MRHRRQSLFQQLDSLAFRKNTIRTDHEPEKLLMFAVLKDGIACFEKYLTVRDPEFRREENWFLRENGDSVFSFAGICGILGLDRNCIRRELLRWKEKTQAELNGQGIARQGASRTIHRLMSLNGHFFAFKDI